MFRAAGVDMTARPIPAELWRDSEWSAALHIGLTAFAHDGRFWSRVCMPGETHLDFRGIDFEGMLEDGTFSSGEFLLVQVAASLFNSTCDVPLARLCGVLDDRNWAIVMAAIARRRGNESAVIASIRRSLEVMP